MPRPRLFVRLVGAVVICALMVCVRSDRSLSGVGVLRWPRRSRVRVLGGVSAAVDALLGVSRAGFVIV